MSLIKVTSEELEHLSTNVTTGSHNIHDQLQRLQSEILGVVGGDWEGVASNRFQALWDEWHRSAAGLKDALDGIARLLAQAGNHYHETEMTIRNSMG